jgi:hypothetical protein
LLCFALHLAVVFVHHFDFLVVCLFFTLELWRLCAVCSVFEHGRDPFIQTSPEDLKLGLD